MRPRHDRHQFLPTPAQRLLLRACLLDTADAQAAWEQWSARVDLDTLDAGSVRLLPLLHSRLVEWRTPSPLLGRIGGVHRHTWYRNQLLLGHVAELTAAWRARGIEGLALKGLALGPLAYGQVGLRPMADADILVPTHLASEAVDTLLTMNWRRAHRPETWPPRFMASAPFVHDLGLELDLHTHVLHQCLNDGDDADFWAAAIPLDLGAARCRTLCIEDHVLHVVTHGLRHNGVPPVRWLVDATLLLRAAGGQFNWPRLVAQAQGRDLTLLVARGLTFLRELCEVHVPPNVLTTLSNSATGVVEQVEYWARSRPGLARQIAEMWCTHQRARMRDPEWRGVLGFPRYLRDLAGLPSLALLPAHVNDRLRQRMTGPRRVEPPR